MKVREKPLLNAEMETAIKMFLIYICIEKSNCSKNRQDEFQKKNNESSTLC